MARRLCIRNSKLEAAREFVRVMEESGQVRTGDGVRWTVTNVKRAMSDM